MLINLTELFTRDGKEKTCAADLEMTDFNMPAGACQLSDKKPVILHFVNEGNRVLSMDGHAEFSLIMPCSRCLEPVKIPFSLSLDRIFDMKKSSGDREKELDEQPYLQGFNLDVDRLVLDELLPNLPMKVLCKEDCKGLCNRCGANLNHQTCDCDRSTLDPRMSVIQDIFKQYKEV